MNLLQATDFKHRAEREGFLNLLPNINNFGPRLRAQGPARESQQTAPPFPRPCRDLAEAVESGGLAGRMDAAWTQRGGVSERICKQNQWLDAPDALAATLFVYILLPTIGCLDLLRPLRPHPRICWVLGLHGASTSRPGASAGAGKVFAGVAWGFSGARRLAF